jgi:hypothetical protein
MNVSTSCRVSARVSVAARTILVAAVSGLAVAGLAPASAVAKTTGISSGGLTGTRSATVLRPFFTFRSVVCRYEP